MGATVPVKFCVTEYIQFGKNCNLFFFFGASKTGLRSQDLSQ